MYTKKTTGTILALRFYEKVEYITDYLSFEIRNGTQKFNRTHYQTTITRVNNHSIGQTPDQHLI